jgi:hypothetical protein
MASTTAVFVEPVTRRRIRFPVGVEAQIDRASPACYAVTVELGVSALVAVSVLEGRPARCWHARNPHLGLHQWDHFATTIDLLEDPHVL